MRIFTQALSCDWCEDAFDMDDLTEEDDADDAAQAAGWIFLVYEGDQLDFCGIECLNRKLS